ncbi:GNAT family N-acetyltransferase [Terracoccus luteus]|uniref:GNAT superfamily N-acetyltransferase n=1 Tax=Terracoccus luteus TaxID=53356 RepID=A0A495XST8_9MICO|nr:GNAT family N-acetyltransferase [Terracoccus luteus]MBB2985150.1 GNAT superfamily N-acetyltransferase [Terracoccus luteus]MCP2170802.1 GNAT superfamily N-acetyltransferase [Terracoccus luteus]RKT77591.1 ribosomal protein S18 acetylase RimI-like enzyme [Terracoccus luteus]
MSDLEVRLARGDDLAGILSVGHRTWLATYEPITGPEYVALGLAKWWTADAVTPTIRSGRTLVAVVDDEVVGVATHGMLGEDVVLWKLYVLPQHHGAGIGSRLLAAVEQHAVEHDHARIVLSHIAGNDDAARFYARKGFTETHREEGGSGMPDQVWMAKTLTAPEEQA